MNKREHNKKTNNNSYSANPSSELTVDELIESIRDKIQQTLERKAEKAGRHRR